MLSNVFAYRSGLIHDYKRGINIVFCDCLVFHKLLFGGHSG